MSPAFLAVKLFLKFSCLLITVQALVAQEALIKTGSVWQFRRGTSEASSPVSAWRVMNFNASGFSDAPAPFWYGDVRVGGTELTDMRYNYTCIFLRKTFVVTDPAKLNGLNFSAFVDDGLVAWINGVEVLRVNVPPGEPTYQTLCTNQTPDPAVVVNYVLPASQRYLLSGTNILAVQVFNHSASSSDLGFDVALTGQTLDTESPVMDAVLPAANATVHTLNQITVTFSEPVVGVDPQDLLIDGLTAYSVVPNDQSTTFTFSFTQPPPGEVNVQWDDESDIRDFAGNSFDVSSTNATWTYTLADTVAPQVSELTPEAGATVTRLTQVELMFDEPVSGVDATDLLVNNQSATNVSGDGAGPYIFEFPQPSSGTVQFAWAAGRGIHDLAADPNAFAGGTWTVTLDPTASQGDVVINEFMAANLSGLADEDSEAQDWIEIYNRGSAPVNLLGWSLTDDKDVPGKWIFPSRVLNPGAYLVVFASGKDRRSPVGANKFHTNFKLNSYGEYLALFNPEFPRTPTTEFTNGFPEQRNDYSYGLINSNEWRYFQTPTPGAPDNISTVTGIAPEPHFSVARGWFDAPFQLLLSTPLEGATIRYTTDGSEPTALNGFDYSGALTISNITTLRAATFKSGYLPSRTRTESYLFVKDVLVQSNTPPGFATNWGTSSSGGFPNNVVPADYEMDPEIVTNPVYGPRLPDALRSLPSVSLVINEDDMFGATNGIYSHTSENQSQYRGTAWERACSIELMPNDGSAGFQVDCGIRMQGNASRAPYKTPKHSFRLFFKGEYGPGRLDFPVYPDTAVASFNTLVMRADFNNSWLHWSGEQRQRGTRIRDGWTKEAWRDMGHPGSHTRYFNLYINGLYWGVYDFGERIDGAFAANYFGGEPEDYDAIASKPVAAVDGDLSAYNAMISAVRYPDMSILSNYSRAQQFLDMPTFIDYMLLNFFGGNEDWGFNSNWNAVRHRAPGETFKYVVWDGEQLITDVNIDRVHDNDLPSGLHTNLVHSPEYRLAFADRVQKHLFDSGALSPQADIARLLKHSSQVDLAMFAESARWGDYRRDVHSYSSGPYDLYTHDSWSAEINRLVTSYFPNRTAIFLQQLRGAGLYPAVDAPVFNQHGGRVAAGFQLSLSAPAGTIYFTTNGLDPRVYGSGDVSSAAIAYSGPVTLKGTATVKARAWNGTNNWSALEEATFAVGELGVPLRISEIMYHPPGGDAYEFIEVLNIGGAPLDVGGFSFQGINYIFPDNTVIQPGATLLLGSDSDTNAFLAYYAGVSVAGFFGGHLSNSGERIAILDRAGNIVTAVEYEDGGQWPSAADGGGRSLEVVDPRAVPNAPSNWRVSLNPDGTPGLPPAAPQAVGDVVLNELMAENLTAVTNGSATPDWVELENRGVSPTDITGWSLSDQSDERKFVFPTGTAIPAGGHLVVWCDSDTNAPGFHAGFGLNRDGDSVFLLDASSNRVDALTFGLQIADLSIGRIGNQWQLTQPTPDSNNVAFALAPITNLTVNEWLANSAPGTEDWLELYNRSATAPVALGGVYLSADDAVSQLGALSFLPPHRYVQLLADEKAGVDHLEFKLRASGGTIALADPTGSELERVTFGPQAEGVSAGRLPDGSGNVSVFAGSASPGASNYLLAWSGPVLNELLARNQRAVVTPWGDYADFVELINPGVSAVDLGGMALGRATDDNKRWFFPAGTAIGAGQTLLVWCDDSRPASSDSGSAPNTGFALPGSGGEVVLFNSLGQPVDSINYGPQLPDLSIGLDGGNWQLLSTPTPNAPNASAATLGSATALRINEWMANPSSGDDWFELYNNSSLPVDLAGLYLTDDPSSSGITNTQITPLSFVDGKKWLKFVADGKRSAGVDHVNFSLDKLGETIRLYDANLNVLDAVDFGTQSTGVSQGRLPDGAAAIVSFPETPTPEESNYLPLTNVVINEVLSHTDDPLEDAVELFNPTASPVAIGGWYLSDSQSDLKRYRIPDGTSIPANGYQVFYQYQFGPADGEADLPPLFSFNSAHGDSVYLSEADGGGNLTGDRVGQSFAAAARGVSFGRYQTSIGVDFTALSQLTFGESNPATLAEFRTGTGASNAYPLVGPVVINEIMYHPPAGDTNDPDASDLEFIELHNVSATNVNLFDVNHPANDWRLANAVSFDFPTNTSIPAGGYLVVVPFDPLTNAAALASFQSRYGNTGSLVGPYSGKLDNAGETIQLWRPDTPQEPPKPDAGFIPYILVDRVAYSDAAPWPAETDGGGASLQRIIATDYGNDPVNWRAESPTMNQANSSVTGPLLLQPHLNGAGQFEFSLNASGSLSYVVEVSSNLLEWNPLMTIPATNAMTRIVDTNNPPSKERFYRVRPE